MSTRPRPTTEDLAKLFGHPLRLELLARMAAAGGERQSPSSLAAETGAQLGNVSYHVRELANAGLITKAGSKPRRGAVEHYYRSKFTPAECAGLLGVRARDAQERVGPVADEPVRQELDAAGV